MSYFGTKIPKSSACLVTPSRQSGFSTCIGLTILSKYELIFFTCSPLKLLTLPSIMGVVIAYFTTLPRSHIYGLPCPSADSLDPIDLYYTFMFQDHPQKFPVYTYTRLLKQYLRVYAAFELKPVYIGMCAK